MKIAVLDASLVVGLVVGVNSRDHGIILGGSWVAITAHSMDVPMAGGPGLRFTMSSHRFHRTRIGGGGGDQDDIDFVPWQQRDGNSDG